MDEHTFFQKIQAGAISGAYLLYGEEPYSREQAMRQIVALVDEDARALNVERMKNPEPRTVVNACETLPFLAPLRVVIVDELSADASAALADYAVHAPDTTALLFSYAAKPHVQNALLKALAKAERAVEFAAFTPERAAAFVEKRAAAQGAAIDRLAVRRLVERAGTDLNLLESTLTRLVDYAGPGRPVTVQAVETCVPAPVEASVFSILDALVAGNKKVAVTGLVELVKSGADTSMRLASFFEGRVKQMLQAKQMLRAGLNEQSVVKSLGGSPYAAKKTVQNARKCTFDQLVNAMEAFASVDFLQKQGLRRDDDALFTAFFSFPSRPE